MFVAWCKGLVTTASCLYLQLECILWDFKKGFIRIYTEGLEKRLSLECIPWDLKKGFIRRHTELL